METKKCFRCKQDKTLNCYNKKKDMRSGLKPYCRECESEYNREYYQKTKEKKRRYNRRYYLENKGKKLNNQNDSTER